MYSLCSVYAKISVTPALALYLAQNLWFMSPEGLTLVQSFILYKKINKQEADFKNIPKLDFIWQS